MTHTLQDTRSLVMEKEEWSRYIGHWESLLARLTASTIAFWVFNENYHRLDMDRRSSGCTYSLSISNNHGIGDRVRVHQEEIVEDKERGGRLGQR